MRGQRHSQQVSVDRESLHHRVDPSSFRNRQMQVPLHHLGQHLNDPGRNVTASLLAYICIFFKTALSVADGPGASSHSYLFIHTYEAFEAALEHFITMNNYEVMSVRNLLLTRPKSTRYKRGSPEGPQPACPKPPDNPWPHNDEPTGFAPL